MDTPLAAVYPARHDWRSSSIHIERLTAVSDGVEIAPVFQAEQGQPTSEKASYAKYAENCGEWACLVKIGSYFHESRRNPVMSTNGV
jgi:hypothetical protein